MNIPEIILPELIFEIEGLAPCGYFSTQKALSFIKSLNRIKKVADIGCGKGYQSIAIYEMIKSKIIAIDHRSEYIRNFQKDLKTQGLDKYIFPLCCQLDNLPFDESELDLIWAESITNEISFKSALYNWNKYLKQGGYIAICAYCWNEENPPEKVVEFFYENKIDINSISARILGITQADFVPTAHFIMPEECWWNYFCPIDIYEDEILKKYPNNIDVRKFVKSVNSEIELFEKYGDSYDYVFFIGEKR